MRPSLTKWKQAWKRRRAKYLPGPSIAGFWGIAEADYGDPETKEPYARVTPSKIGGILLPFRCPSCKQVNYEFSDAKRRDKYKDKRPGHGNHWCPICRSRFYLVEDGMPLQQSLPANATHAPARVERGTSTTTIFSTPNMIGLDMIWQNDSLESSAEPRLITKYRGR